MSSSGMLRCTPADVGTGPASIAAALLGPLDPGNEVTNTSK